MIKIINKIVLKNHDGEILETSTRNLKSEKYKNCTIIDYKYILEIIGEEKSVNEIVFSSSKERTNFLKTLNNYLISENNYKNSSFNSYDFPIIEVELMADKIHDFHEGLALVEKDGLYGYIDKNGNEVIKCQFNNATDFHEGLARVKKDGKYGFINKDGVEVIPCKYDYACNFSEGLAAVYIDEKLAFINKNNNIVINCDKDYYDYTKFHEGLAKVNLKRAWLCTGFIDKTGTIVIPYGYDDASDFHEGLAAVNEYKSLKWGYINKAGEKVIPCVYTNVYNFSEGLARVKKDGKHGFINKDGKEVIPYGYNCASDFHEGLAAVRIDGKYGFIDKTGAKVIYNIYDGASDFHEGLAAVRIGKKYGFIDKTGTTVIPYEYDYACNFSEGLAKVKKAGKWIFIDKQNQKFNCKIVLKSIEDVLSISNNSKIVGTKTAYVLDFKGSTVLFDSSEEREEFIKSLDETINIDSDLYPKKLTKRKTNI